MASDTLYWDSNVIIDCLQKGEPWHHIEPILKQAEAGRIDIIVSALCLAEVIKDKTKPNEDVTALIEQFFEQPYVHVYSANESTMKLAGQLRLQHELTTIDAIHLATALERKVGVFLTRDGTSGKKTGILNLKNQFKSPKMDIMTPAEYFSLLSTESKQDDIEVHIRQLDEVDECDEDDTESPLEELD